MSDRDLGRSPSGRAGRPKAQAPAGLGDTATIPNAVEILSLGYADPPVECSRARWWEVFRAFDRRASYHAANLAAHNWDVLLVGGRVFLFQTRYGGERGHWLNLDGARDDASGKEHAALYTRARKRRFAQAIEARRAGNAEGGAVGDESAVTK